MKETMKKSITDSFAKRNFRYMPTLDKYILKEFLIIYICMTLAFCTLFLISDLINKFGDFQNNFATVWDTIYYFILRQPGDITFVFPIALLLSTMYTMAKFGMNNEITAMRASGVSLFRCGFSLYIIGIIVTGVNFWFNESVVPNCNKQALIVRKNAAVGNYIALETRMLVYRTPNGQRTWLVDKFTSNDSMQGIRMKKYSTNGTMQLELYAKKGKYSPSMGWSFYNVKIVTYKDIQLQDKYSPISVGKKQTIIIPVTKKMKVFDKKDKYFAALGKIFETPRDFINSVDEPEQWPSSYIKSVLDRASGLAKVTVDLYETILWYRLAFPWVCLLSVFLGIPLAASNERSGIMIAVMTAVAIIVIYEVFSQVFQVLGKTGNLPPFIAGTTPTFLLVAYVVYNTIKRR